MNATPHHLKRHLLGLATMLLLLPSQAVTASSFVLDNLENGIADHWKKKLFTGETKYSITEIDGRKCIKAESQGSASGLFYALDIDPQEYQHLSWEWRVDHTVEGGDVSLKSGDDYAARIYVVFPGFFFWQTKALNYIWANKLEKGAMVPSAYTSKSIMIAVESGKENTGKFTQVQRNIYQDFWDAFGSAPPNAGAIAIMTDSDDTGTQASACYGPITLSP